MESAAKTRSHTMSDKVLQFQASQAKFIMYLLLLLPVLGILLAACGGGGGGGQPSGT
jgi:hypothetical protein